MPLTFLSLGSGSCGNCYYIATDTDAIIVDCGVGIRRFKKNMAEYGMKIGKVRAILITHDHSDHIKGAGKISREFKIPVYATQGVHDGMYRNWMMTDKVPMELRHSTCFYATFSIGDFAITPFPIPHDATENVGYHINVGDVRFTIMTDVGDVTQDVCQYISQSTHLILEANYDEEMLLQGRYPQHLKRRISCGTGHLANTKTANALAQNFHENLKHVWLCHLSEENNHPELARKTVESILREHGIIAGVDFKLDVLRRKIPTGPFNLQ